VACALVFLAAAGATLAGVVLLARGLSATMADLLGGKEGLGQLLSGALLLLCTLALVAAAIAWSERRLLRKLKRSMGESERFRPASDGARSALELLEQEERRSLEALKGSLVALGEDLCAARELRELVRKHPELAVATSAALGVLAAPLAAGLAREVLLLALRVSAGNRGWTGRLP
jgi:hypothetical protein